ncbi:unnamed protein product [Adineta steineri]|uniref:Gamma-aminobutyric acid receptor subunit beta n=1 Tax=Adineta steineri TaxID=433720 RepID=A0A815YE06_9BILA|nr:unnamed protein product [Adineta steineri]CAF1569286.1 unnamed protein product [Adineta steineri]
MRNLASIRYEDSSNENCRGRLWIVLGGLYVIILCGGILAAVILSLALPGTKKNVGPRIGNGITVAGGNRKGSLPDQLNDPHGFFVDNQSNIYVADTNNHRIVQWLPDAKYGIIVAGGNGPGSKQNQLRYPSDIWIDRYNNMYIADPGNRRVQLWTSGATSGQTVFNVTDGWSSSDYYSLYVDEVNQEIYIAARSAGQIFRYTLGSRMGVLVADGFGRGNGSHQFNYQRRFTVDRQGKIYVADKFNHRIQKWSRIYSTTQTIPTAKVETIAGITGKNGSNLNQLYNPTDVILDLLAKNIYIADYGNARVIRLPANLADSKREGVVVLNPISVNAILDDLLKSYDRYHRPTYGGEPDKIIVNIYVRSMSGISELDMEYSFDCFFRQRWTDTRLIYNTTSVMNYTSLPVSFQMFSKIWKPDTYFYNGQRSYIHSVPHVNRFFRIATDGTILYSQRLTIRASCIMNLRNLPLDTQHCTLLIGSFAYNSEETIYEWSNKTAVDLQNNLIMNQFSLIDASVGSRILIRENRTRSIIYVVFAFRRHVGYFLLQLYIPCVLIVFLSWVGLWLNREATNDRINLGVTTILTLIFVIIEGKKDLPKVPYITALDCFLAVCFIFVFSTLFEFAIVHYYTKARTGDLNENMRDLEDYVIRDDGTNADEHDISRNDVHLVYRPSLAPTPSINSRTSEKKSYKCYRNIRCKPAYSAFQGRALKNIFYSNSESKIDIFSRTMYPVAFFIFNFIYWAYYLHASQQQSKGEKE